MPRKRSTQALLDLFASKTVVDLPAIELALGGVSQMTAFRYLREVPYRRSYNKNGRYYTLHERSKYDRLGLWSWGGIHFSVDGSLRTTVRRLVQEAEAGATHRELRDRLQLRVQNTLLDLLRKGEVERERLDEVYVYLHSDSTVREAQLEHRREWIVSAGPVGGDEELRVSDGLVIAVLLALIRRPGWKAADVMRSLRGHSPPILFEQVRAVFDRYDLDRVGEKGGSSTR